MEEKGAQSSWSWSDSGLLLIITLMSGLSRFINIRLPEFPYFDEAIYRKDACQYLDISGSACALPYQPTETHPPLGKWLIGTSMKVFGDSPLGWRMAAVIFGCAGVATLYVLSRRLLDSRVAALWVGVLWGLDPLHFVMSRIGMLEIFVPTLGLLAMLLLIFALDSSGLKRFLLWSACGTMLGLAVATKWSGVFYIGLASAYLLHHGRQEAQREGAEHPFDFVLRRYALVAFSALLLVPVLIYASSFAGRLGNRPSGPDDEGWLGEFASAQSSMLQTHFYLPGSNDLASPAVGWPVGQGSFDMIDQGQAAAEGSVLLTANRPLWVIGLVTLTLVCFSRLRRKEGGWLAVTGWASMYVPWLLLLLFQELSLGAHREATYLYYMLPATPFMYLAVGTLLDGMTGRKRSLAAITVALIAGVGFVLLYPDLSYA